MNQNLSRENVLAYKKQTNICVSLRRKSLKRHLKRITEKEINTNKSFWKFIKLFLTNNYKQRFVTLVENKVVTTDEKTLASTFNKHCVNIVEITCEKIPKNFSKISHGKSKQEVLCDILNAYKTHPRIKQIEKKFNGKNFFRKEKVFFKPVTP